MYLCLTNLSFIKKNFNFFANKVNKLDYRCIEIAPYLISKKPFLKKNITYIKNIILKNKLNIISIQSLFYNNKIKIVNDKDIQKYFTKIFKFAKALNIKKISIGNAPFRRLNINKKDLLIKNFLIFNNLSNLAKEYNIIICIEPISKKYGNLFLNTHNETINFIKKINRNNVRLLFDTGNYYDENKIAFNIYFLKNIKYIEHMHISQSVISKIDKKDLIKSLFFLNKIKYKKSVTIEYINNNGGDSLNKKDFS
tara:strand:- start:152 stop:910 length:759 start_codon:yes stop_codon:yes gene_type:complete